MKMTTVVCEQCGDTVERPKKEVTRSLKLGRKQFCDESCAALYNNVSIPRVTRQCPVCNKTFATKDYGKGSNTFCGRDCSNQMPRRRDTLACIEGRRKAGLKSKNLLPLHEVLKRREAWKYVELTKRLRGYPHEFECKIGSYIFDLVLLAAMIAVEFDGPDHRIEKQRETDAKKEAQAVRLGYTVLHRQVKRASVIPANALDGIVP